MDNRYDWMKGRYYKHYKGGIYQVIDVAMHTEDNYPLVVYKSTNDNVWARPLDMFKDKVVFREESGCVVYKERFEQVDVYINGGGA